MKEKKNPRYHKRYTDMAVKLQILEKSFQAS